MSSCAELRRARPLLGTIVEITASGAGEAQLELGIARAFAAVEKVHRLMSYHDPESDIGRLNEAPAREAVRVHRWTHHVVRCAQRLAVESGGVFDITVAPELIVLGYLPRPAAPRQTRATFRDLEVLPGSLLRARRSLRIDLGGIAKGFAVDRAIAALQAVGVRSALINAGGDLRACGPRAWPVAIRHPSSPGITAATLAVRDAALATSATTFSRRRLRGRWISPLLDGATRRAFAGVASISILASDCLHADALTKIALARPDLAPAFLARYGARALLLDGDSRAQSLDADAA